ncbi:MAG: hypothetical protein F6J93_13775 [Oscillatoria sp. SIO1A7]|nr:hypothetical protein [Oscillatoria sp. SIO1A7]
MVANLGFANQLKCEPKKSTTKKTEGERLKSINEVHAKLLTYVEDVPDQDR